MNKEELSDFYEKFVFEERSLPKDSILKGKKLTGRVILRYGTEAELYKGAQENGYYSRMEPEILILKSPMACQLAAFILPFLKTEIKEHGWHFCQCVIMGHLCEHWDGKEKGIWPIIEKYCFNDFERRLIDRVSNFVSYKIWEEVWHDIKKIIGRYLRRSGINLYFYDGINFEYNFKNVPEPKSQELLDLGVADMIRLPSLTIVSEFPIRILKNEHGQLHCSNNSAVEWSDGFGLFYWNGIKVPREWIINKETIDKRTVLSEPNIERRRCIMEILGAEKYFELLNVVCIDDSIDEHGNPIKLYRTKEKEPKIEEYLFYLFVVDPSTKREYSISVPPSYDVYWAKASTFDYKKIEVRHGDVGLLNLESPFSSPRIET